MNDIKKYITLHRKYIILSVIAAIILSFALGIFLVRKISTDPDVVFLSPSHGAVWIHFREPESYAAWGPKVLVTTYSTKFRVKHVPNKAILSFCAMKRATVWLDNHTVYNINTPLEEWKKVRHVDLAPMLKPGIHELRISVLNVNGHPMLLAYCNALKLFTGETWRCSKDGKHWKMALSADHMLPPPISRWFQRADKAFISHLYLFVPVFLMVFALTLLVDRKEGPPWTPRFTPTANRIHYLVLGAWIILSVNNIFRLPLYTGTDFPAHMDYIIYIANKMRIPFANEGWQMFESPLFYIISAIIYKAAHNIFSLETTYRILRIIPLMCGAAQIELSYRALRYVYPDREDLQALGTIIAGLLPVNIYISQVVGTEPLSGILTGIVAVLVVRLITDPSKQSPLFFIYMGLFLGLALLAKISAILIILPVVLFTSWVVYKENKPKTETSDTIGLIIKRIGIVLGMAFLVSSWYYLRNYLHLGHFFVGGWDTSRGIVWWQDPGYRTLNQFTSFGEALFYPIYSISSVWNSLYSTMWLDGFLSGIDGENFILPWNYGFMLSSTWLSLFPLAAILLGTLMVFKKSNNKLRTVIFFSASCIFIYLSAILYISLRIPIYSIERAKYTVGLIPCFAILVAEGLHVIMRKRILRAVTYGIVACWAISSYASFFVLYNPDCVVKEQLYLANITTENGKIDQSIRHYRKALSINPYSLEAHLNLGVALAKEGRLNKAVGQYEKALEIDPDCAEAHNDIGVVLVHKGKIDDAIDHFRKALKIKPDYAGAKKNLNIALKAKERVARINLSISRIKDRLKAEPGNPELYNKLGDLYRARGDLGEALEQYQKALRIRPDSIQALSNIAIVYATKGAYKKALSSLEKIIELMPKNSGAYYNIACIYARQNKVDEAVSWLKKAIDKGFANWELIRKDPDLRNIRDTEYYKELVQRYK